MTPDAASSLRASDYHESARCGACDGPLEVSRDAVCETCVPEDEWFRLAAEAQDVSSEMRRAKE